VAQSFFELPGGPARCEMGKKEKHKQDLIGLLDELLESGDAEKLLGYIASNSNLPSPRANLELAAAFSELMEDYSRKAPDPLWAFVINMTGVSPDEAPVNAPREFIPFCGAAASGAIASVRPQFFEQALAMLRALARDPRWRMREAVPMALHKLLGKRTRNTLKELERWVAGGDLLEMRAAAAAVADPAALKDEETAWQALQLHRSIMEQVLTSTDRKSEAFRILRKALGYTVSVVLAALPEEGFEFMAQLIATEDRDALWVVKQNLKKNRLVRNFPEAVEATRRLLE
jgi:hypothetical protein